MSDISARRSYKTFITVSCSISLILLYAVPAKLPRAEMF